MSPLMIEKGLYLLLTAIALAGLAGEWWAAPVELTAEQLDDVRAGQCLCCDAGGGWSCPGVNDQHPRANCDTHLPFGSCTYLGATCEQAASGPADDDCQTPWPWQNWGPCTLVGEQFCSNLELGSCQEDLLFRCYCDLFTISGTNNTRKICAVGSTSC